MSVDVLVPLTRQRRDAGFARLHRTSRVPVRVFVLPFTPRQIRTQPVEVLAAIRDALESGRGRATANLRTVAA